MSHHSRRPSHSVSRRPHVTINRPVYYRYEEPLCFCGEFPCQCLQDTGALGEDGFLTIYPGWNVWNVWQVKDLPFSVMMLGLSPDRQLRIWVEDAVRLGAPGALVADSIDLKGGQVEILNGEPSGLARDQRKEQVPGPAMVVDGPATLKTVRFFNRAGKTAMAWPHDESYLLDQTYVPSPINPATNTPAPDTIGTTVGKGAIEPVKNLLGEIPSAVYVGGVIVAVGYFFRKELFENVKRKLSKRRSARSR